MGHAAVLTKAFQQKLVDKIFIVPTTVNYYRPDKRYLFSFDEKLLIIRDFLVGFKYDAEIDTVEKDKNGDNYAGILDRAIDGVMIKSTKGKARYRVHLINGNWLPWVTGYNINDSIKGYAGNLGHAIDGIQIEIV